MYQSYPGDASSTHHHDYRHLANPPAHPYVPNATRPLHPNAYHAHPNSDFAQYPFDAGVQHQNKQAYPQYTPDPVYAPAPIGTYNAPISAPRMVDPIPTMHTNSQIHSVNYNSTSRDPSSLMVEYSLNLPQGIVPDNRSYMSSFKAGQPSGNHSHTHVPATGNNLFSPVEYQPQVSQPAPKQTQSRSSYRATEPGGRRKSETSTSQARRKSSTNNPYPRSRKEAAAAAPRTYTTMSVLSNELGPIGPTNHLLVPQDNVYGEPTSYNRQLEQLFAPISFRSLGFHELGVKLPQILKQHAEPIDGGDDQVFKISSYREIKIKIQWPGYPHNPYEKRMKTHNCTITRSTVCLVIANMLIDFVMMLKERKVKVEKGYEPWAIGKGGFRAEEFWITGLLHRGGNHFQPEIWVPRT